MPYLDSAGLLHVARLNDYWFKLDEPLISAFVERWRPETHTFHMPFGECTVTLQDVAYQIGLPVDEFPVSSCLSDFKQLMEGGKPVWQWFEELFGELPPEDCIDEFTVSYGCLVPEFTYAGSRMLQISTDSVSLQSCQSECKELSWATSIAAVLDILEVPQIQAEKFYHMYNGSDDESCRWGRYMPSSDEKGPRVIATRHRLDKLRVDDFIWMPYSALEVIQVVHPDILRPEHTHLWKSTTALIYFSSIE
ncbi:protein MAINTENANCE OF MERISTEMS-like [Arachis hypogaea]|uniref:protein MAINTENANCE OF MERISTEMS-like n=1 Tax=Arachis hypogaea TaxID=3818 RepID=UPI003B20C947